VELVSDVGGLRLVLAPTLGDRYRIKVSDDGLTVGLVATTWTHEPPG
jgi:hypothetical protein